MDYGYLPASDMETGNLRTDDQLKVAIRTLQVQRNSSLTNNNSIKFILWIFLKLSIKKLLFSHDIIYYNYHCSWFN